jgi:hypothetical protein
MGCELDRERNTRSVVVPEILEVIRMIHPLKVKQEKK